MNYSVFHVEKYGHGRAESNALADDRKMKIQDHDNYFDVYECYSDTEAEKIAAWYVATYEGYPEPVEIVKQHARYFTIETA